MTLSGLLLLTSPSLGLLLLSTSVGALLDEVGFQLAAWRTTSVHPCEADCTQSASLLMKGMSLRANVRLAYSEEWTDNLQVASVGTPQSSDMYGNNCISGLQQTHSSDLPFAVAVVLRGESFRSGGWNSRNESETADSQMQATRSQSELLVEPFKKRGFHVDVFSATYSGNHTGNLVEAWGPDLQVDHLSQRPGSQGVNIFEGASAVWSHAAQANASYRLVILLRHDMVLKQDVSDLILNTAAVDDKIWIPFFDTKQMRVMPWESNRVPDTMQVIPWRFFGCFLGMLQDRNYDWPNESLASALEDVLGGEDRVGYLMDWYADSSPYTFQNPLYSFAGRPEGPIAPQQ